MPSLTASSSTALSRANDPLASCGARMIVVAGTSSVTILRPAWMLAAAYITSEMFATGSKKLQAADLLDTPSCLIAVRTPSRVAPRDTAWLDAGRCPTTVKVCSRVSTVLTGRPRSRAAAAVSGVWAQLPHLLPNPPPTYGPSACTFAASTPSVVARRLTTSMTPCVAVWTVNWSLVHAATVACGSIALWCSTGVVYVADTVTSLAARASSMEVTPGASTSVAGAPLGGGVALGRPSGKDAAGGSAAYAGLTSAAAS